MKTSYILIDYENVQPDDLDLVPTSGWHVKVVFGKNQKRIPVETANALHALGKWAEYIRPEMTGKNALDFYIAYKIGVYSEQNPGSRFEVIANDNDLEPLLERLRKEGISAHLRRCVADIFSADSEAEAGIKPPTPGDRIQEAVEYLTAHKDKQAKKQIGHKNNLKTHFRLTPDQAEKLVLELQKHRFISVLENSRVEYHFANNIRAAA